MKFIHAADIHLDSPLRGLERYDGAPVEEIRGATRRALENLVDLALRRNVDFVLIAGDLYDGDWKDHNTGLFFARQMVKLHGAGVPVLLISGNHDAASKMTRSLRLPENVIVMSHKRPETVELEGLGVAIHAQSFASAVVQDNVAVDYPAAIPNRFNIGMLHTSLDSEVGGEHARYAPCKVSDLVSKGYDYWALGHIHKRAIVHDDPPIVFAGNIQGRHIRESGAKGCMLVSVDERDRPEINFEPLDVFRWEHCELDAAGAEHGDEIVERLTAPLAALVEQHDGVPLAVRVSISGRCAAHRQLMAAQEHWQSQIRAVATDVAAGNVWIERIRLRTEVDHQRDAATARDGPLEELMRHIDHLRTDDAHLSRLGEELADLQRKLREARIDEHEVLALDDPQWLGQVLDQVEPLLVSRLLAEEAGR